MQRPSTWNWKVRPRVPMVRCRRKACCASSLPRRRLVPGGFIETGAHTGTQLRKDSDARNRTKKEKKIFAHRGSTKGVSVFRTHAMLTAVTHTRLSSVRTRYTKPIYYARPVRVVDTVFIYQMSYHKTSETGYKFQRRRIIQYRSYCYGKKFVAFVL